MRLLPLPSEDPFRQDDSPCKVDRDGSRGATISLPAPPGKPSASRGGLTLRLRDVDMADVFDALHQLTKRGFLVDADVVGRVNLDISGASLDDVLQALRKSGLRISEGMTLVRVSLGSAAPAKPPLVGPFAGSA
jgi:type II secretory pathway component GspD/PulD (secretin)